MNVMTAVAGQIKDEEKGPFFDIGEQRDEWISDGAAEAVFEPRFTFHGANKLRPNCIGSSI